MTDSQDVKAKQLHPILLLATICSLLVLAFGTQTGFSKTPQENKQNQTARDAESLLPLVIRVGAIYYDDSDEQYSRIRSILSALEKQDEKSRDGTSPPIVFKLAVGTYDEVMNWYESAQIDLAIMNPGPLALLIDQYPPEEINKLFVGIQTRTPPPTSIAFTDGATPRSEYNAMMLLNREALPGEFRRLGKNEMLSEQEGQQLIDFVLQKAREHQAHFLFVHPFSTSGYIYPRKVLKDAHVSLDARDYELTYSHDVSRELVRNSSSDNTARLTVAFVSDETANTLNDAKLLAIRSGQLKKKIVQDALLLTPDFARESKEKEVSRLTDLLKSQDDPKQTFNLKTDAEWRKRYQEIKAWIDDFSGKDPLMSNALTIDQIIRRINNYNLHHRKPNAEPARLALVLSGGGAKCAYQLGAVEVIEDKLSEAQKANPEQKLGIDLVVGTSGGAINALTVAAEATKDPTRRTALRRTWESFAQAEILKPSDFVRRLLGLWLGFIASLFLVMLLRPAAKRKRRAVEVQPGSSKRPPLKRILDRIGKLNWAARVGIYLLLLSLVLYLIGLKQIDLTSPLGPDTLLRHHVWIHIVEYGKQTLRWAALAVFLCGLFLCFDSFSSRWLVSRYESSRRLWRTLALSTVVLLSFFLPLIAGYTTFMIEDSLFVSDGIEQKMAVEIPKILRSDTSSHSLALISKDIIQKGLIKRDLVITGSMLQSISDQTAPQTSGTPRAHHDDTDLYFLYTKDSPTLPEAVRKDNRFVSLRDSANESILLDAVIGSGSIFPAFEPRRLSGVKRVMDKAAKRDVDIIDGGFVHNSPIEAAVQLKATHIIVIEASPEDHTSTDVNLLTNSLAAFNHLFTQAQLLDARSQRRAEIFTLRPAAPGSNEAPFLCTLDFGRKYIGRAMQLGHRDASDAETPRFVRQPRPAGL